MTTRLSRYLARAGVTSRRGAAGLVASGKVRINGRPASGPGDPVEEGDVVTVEGRRVVPVSLRWILLHKPTGYVTSRAPTARFRPVFDLLEKDEALVAVGRLDVMSEGALLLTTDGGLAARLMHPRHQVPRRYAVEVAGDPGPEGLAAIRRGVKVDDGPPVRALDVRFSPGRAGGRLELTLTEGRNRVVRRLCAALGLPVRKLVRTAYGPVNLGDLERGASRPLTGSEVTKLYKSVDLTPP